MANNNPRVIPFPKAALDQPAGRLLIPEKIAQARIAARLSQAELARKIGVTRQAVSYFEKGERTPDFETLQAIAVALDQPIRYFSTPASDGFGRRSSNFFRKQGPDTKRRNAACDQYADWLAQSVFAFDAHISLPAVNLPRFEPTGLEADESQYSLDEIERLAEATRKHLGLGLGPISNTVRLLESNGVAVARLILEGENVGAFSFWSGARPFIFLASDKESAARARFDACHELGHLVLHRWVTQDELEDKARLKVIEREADFFAGAFLLPRGSFPNEVISPRLDAFLDLKMRWKVSIQAMIYRCKNLGIFDEDQCVNLYKQISAKNWRTREPMDGPGGLPLEEPLLLRRAAEMVFQNDRMKSDELVQRLGLNEALIEGLLALPKGTLAESTVDEPPLELK